MVKCNRRREAFLSVYSPFVSLKIPRISSVNSDESRIGTEGGIFSKMNDMYNRPGMDVMIRETGETRKLDSGPLMIKEQEDIFCNKMLYHVVKVVPAYVKAKGPNGADRNVRVDTMNATIVQAEGDANRRDFSCCPGVGGMPGRSISQAGYDFWNDWAGKHRSDLAKLKAIQDKYLDEKDPKTWSDMCKTIRKNLFPAKFDMEEDGLTCNHGKCRAEDEHARFEATFQALHDEYGIAIPNLGGRPTPDISGISMAGPDDGLGIV